MRKFVLSNENITLDSVPGEIFIINRNGEIIFANKFWCRRFFDFNGVGNDYFLKKIKNGDRVTLLTLLGANSESFKLDCQITQTDGQEKWFILTAHSQTDMSAGIIWICTLTDIDERVKYESEMRERVKVRGDMLDASLDCIKVITPDGRLRHLNEAGRVALGIQIDSGIGVEIEWVPLLPAEVHASARAALKTASGGRAARFYGSSQLPDRSPQYWDNMLTPVTDENGKVSSVLCVSREITQQREAETRLQLAIRASNNAIWDYDLKHNRVIWSEALEEHYGYHLGEIDRSGEWRSRHIHPADRDRVRESIDRAVRNGESDFSHEFRFARADGRYVDVLERGGISRDINGQAVRIVGTLIDQTDRKTVERYLREANRTLKITARKNLEELSRLWNISRDVLVLADGSGVITRVNPAFEVILGFPPDFAVGRHLAEFALPSDQQKLRELLSGDTIEPVEIRHGQKHGTLQWIEWVISRSSTEIHAAGRHITSMKEAEIALRQIEDRFCRLFRLAPVPMILSSLQGRILEVNDAFTKLIGHSVSSLDHDGALDSIFDTSDFISNVSRVIDQGGVVREEEFRIRTNGNCFMDCLVSAEILSLKDGRCLLAAFRDVTARRRSEVELMKAIDTVMADASWFSQKVIEKLAQIREPRHVDRSGDLGSLSSREREVLELICRGMADSEIANTLHLSRHTIRNHLASIYSKLNLHSRSSVIVWARQRGL